MNILEHLVFAQIALEGHVTPLAAWAAREHIRRAIVQLPRNIPWDRVMPVPDWKRLQEITGESG